MNNTLNTSITSPNTSDNETNFEVNFNSIMNACNNNYSYNDLIELLASDKIIEKQFAALELEEIKSKEDAFVLVSNLVGQDGKIREAVAFKINELIKEEDYLEYFIGDEFFEIFLEGIMDINGNVCRKIVELSNIKEFNEYLCKKLPERIKEILKEIKKLDENDKQYKISKRNFQLYWCLESLFSIFEKIELKQLKDILLITGEFDDYTIREKTAKILIKIDISELNDLKNKLKNDTNYYVRRYL